MGLTAFSYATIKLIWAFDTLVKLSQMPTGLQSVLWMP